MSNTRTWELTDEEKCLIQEYREKKRKEEAKSWAPRLLSDIPIKEKVDTYNKLYQMALDHFSKVKIERRVSDDVSPYMHQAVMLLLGPDVFKHYNEFVR